VVLSPTPKISSAFLEVEQIPATTSLTQQTANQKNCYFICLNPVHNKKCARASAALAMIET
jgi:hypothetical protein